MASKASKARDKASGGMSPRRELVIWQVAGWLISYLPLLLVLFLRRERYFTGYTGLRVSTGVVVVLVIGLLTALKKMKLPSRVATLWGVVAVLWLLIPLLNDMLLLLCMLAVGSTVDEVVCGSRIRVLRRRIQREERVEDVEAGVTAALRRRAYEEEQGHE